MRTLPSTITMPLSTYDWDVLVPLIGAFNLPKPFLLGLSKLVPDVGAESWFGGVFGFGGAGPERGGVLVLHWVRVVSININRLNEIIQFKYQ